MATMIAHVTLFSEYLRFLFVIVHEDFLRGRACTILLGLLMAMPASLSIAKTVCYQHATVLVGDKFIRPDNFCYDSEQGTIVAPTAAAKKIEARGKSICPGFIDIQLNGAFGKDFTSDASSIIYVAKKIGATGVTAFSPTFISSLKHQYELNAQAVSVGKVVDGAEVLKLHLEGPFIDKIGTHSAEAALFFKKNGDTPLTFEIVEQRYGALLEKTAIITLAPQAGSNAVIANLAQRGIVVSLGHSSATYEEGVEAIKHGASFFTHLFNAMGPLHHRSPGLPLVSLTNQAVFYGMIADGIHVHPAMVAFAYKNNPNMILVTDAMAGLGLASNTIITIGNQAVKIIEHIDASGRSYPKAVKIVDGIPAIVDGDMVLAGSVISMIDSVNKLKTMLGPQMSWADVIKTATTNPSTLLAIHHRKNLSLGADADFLVIKGELDTNNVEYLEIEETVSSGCVVYVKTPS